MEFPQYISFTVTNSCNLRCRMCGQWSEEGYINKQVNNPGSQLKVAGWKKLVDEIASYDIEFILIRGGEPFLYPGIIELLEHINSKGINIPAIGFDVGFLIQIGKEFPDLAVKLFTAFLFWLERDSAMVFSENCFKFLPGKHCFLMQEDFFFEIRDFF